jgi:hypothetical protein
MKKKEESDLKLDIDELDRLLIDGYKIYQVIFNDYEDVKTHTNFDLEKYFNKSVANYTKWNDKCYDIIKRLPRLHYLFHFVKPKRPVGIRVFNLPDRLSNTKTFIEYQLYALEDIILSLEEGESLALRKEIAEREHQADILYKITYSSHTRKIKINNLVIHTPDFNSENDIFFNYVIKNAGRPIPFDELESISGDKINKRLIHIVRDLGFTGNLKKIFFPVVSKNKVMFVNPITKQYAHKHDLPVLNFKSIVRKSEK